jgi:hypothetical protein
MDLNMWQQVRCAHASEAAQLLELAQRLGERDAQAFAVRAVAAASANPWNTNLSPVDVARLVGLTRPRFVATAADRANTTALLMRLRDVVNPRQVSGGANTTNARPVNYRSDDQARASFNYRKHWRRDEAGRLVPDEKKLSGQPAQMWSAVTNKFGPELARSLFDANVRGGLLAVINALDAAGSKQPLNVEDVTSLQYLALHNGQATPSNNGVDPPSLHDAVHSAVDYGVNELQELYGDVHSEGLLVDVFAEGAIHRLDPRQALTSQTAAVARLSARIDQAHGGVSLDQLAYELRAAFVSGSGAGLALKEAWTGTPSANTQQAAKMLSERGLISHLQPQPRQRILALVYGKDRPDSFEAIANRYGASGDRAQFARDVDAWLGRVGKALTEASANNAMSNAEFRERAARSLAFGLVLEAASPGVLQDGPVDTLLVNGLPKAVTAVDLRQQFPQKLQEVRQALDQAKRGASAR